MISGHGDLETAVNTMRLGAFDYISKPPDLNRLLNTVRIALDRKELVVENKMLKKKVSKNYEMIGNSVAIDRIKDMIDKVARINRIRTNNKEEIEARGQDVRYEFDYLLLCNKICGSSHYNMQLKIVVDEEADFTQWLASQKTFAQLK